MSLRQYFAAKAMQSMLTGNRWDIKELVESSYQVADAMLAEAKEAKPDVKPQLAKDWYIQAIKSMPDGADGFLKSWGLEDFGKAVAAKVCGAPVPTEAPSADADGWIEWAGYTDHSPVDLKTTVEYRFRSGKTGTCKACALAWQHDGDRKDIVAYRVVVDAKPTPTPAPTSAPDADGWIEWHGWECPVPPETIVEYKMRNRRLGKYKAKDLIWDLDGHYDDIIAYRVVK